MKISDDELAEINKELLLTFGYEHGYKPRYQLSWTTGLEELRTGLYVKFDQHGNEIGNKIETKRVLKYPFNQDRYVLERLFYFKSPELPMAFTTGSYESIYYFEDGDRKPLPVTKDVVLAICRILESPKEHKTPADFENEEEKARKKQIEQDYLFLEEAGRSAIFYDNSGVFVDSTKRKE